MECDLVENCDDDFFVGKDGRQVRSGGSEREGVLVGINLPNFRQRYIRDMTYICTCGAKFTDLRSKRGNVLDCAKKTKVC